MKKNILFTLLFFITINLFSQQHIVKFEVENKKEAYKLPEFVQVDKFNNNTVTAYLYGENFDKFKKSGYKFQVQDHPAKGKALTMATTVAQMANWDRYPTFDVLNQMIDQFATDYPNICRVETIGTSEDGREIKVIKISDNPDVDEEEPEFYYTGQMHGDEIVAYIMFLRLADYMLSNYGTASRVTNIINNTEIWINPLSNPDGTYNGGNNTVSSATRSNSNGVDLNRNFPSPNKPNPSGQNESEVQMQIAFAQAHHFVMSANSHSGIELINYPWDSWTSSHPHADQDWWEHISYNYADTVHSIAPSGYFTGQGDGVTHGGDWYVVDGSRQDNMCYYQYCRELTLELSDAKMLDASLLPAHWIYNKSAMLGYIEECHYGFNGTVKNTNGDPLNAKIEITGHDVDNSEVYTDPAKGDYYRPIEPGTYDVTYSSYGYISQTISVTVSNWEATTIQNVVLQQASTVTVTGTVTEDGTSNPLQGVKIEFLNEAGISPVFTDASGNYTVPNVMENTYNIKASKTGYTAVIKNEAISTSNTTIDFTLAISNAISFETEVPSIFTFGGNADWTRVSPEAYDGTYSMKSGNISDNQSTTMQTELNITSAGNIIFYKKVSSESNYDFLRFYIDGTQKGEWSGELDWSQESYAVTTGVHTFKWEYSKDVSVGNGSDCAWVDYIEFPQYEETATYTVTFNVSDGTNPIEGAIIIFNSQNKSTDIGGQAIFTEVEPANNIGWNISKAGYSSQNGTLNVIDQDVVTNISLIPVLVNDLQKITNLKISPNPFNQNTSFEFYINEKSNIFVGVYSYNGQLVKTLMNNEVDSGKHRIIWDGTNANNRPIANGLYFCKIINDGHSITEKIILIR